MYAARPYGVAVAAVADSGLERAARLRWHGEVKRRPISGLRLHPDAAAVSLDDTLGDDQAHARPGILSGRVKPFEYLEDPRGVLRLDADAVIAHREHPGAPALVGPDVNHRPCAGNAELDGVRNQVLQHLG